MKEFKGISRIRNILHSLIIGMLATFTMAFVAYYLLPKDDITKIINMLRQITTPQVIIKS
ncbi:MAG: hypothetical protein WC975_01645 [Phycisphaerae bacterium]